MPINNQRNSFKTTVVSRRPGEVEADLLAVPVIAGKDFGEEFSEELRDRLKQLMKERDFKGEWGSAAVFAAKTSFKTPFVAVIGLGEGTEPAVRQAEAMRRGLGKVVREARGHNVREIALNLWGIKLAALLAQTAFEAASLSDYHFTDFSRKHREQQAKRGLKHLVLLVAKESQVKVKQAVKESAAVMEGVTLARDLVNQPAGHMFPAALVKTARDIARKSPQVTLKVMDRKQAAKDGWGAFLAVAAGSVRPPYVIHLIYKPKGKKNAPKVFLVGKGITFDSGGLSLKPADYMESMKIDMAGAAVVLGAFAVIDTIKPEVEVHGVIAACENMPSGSAYRPGDIVTAKNGTTIEVLNTDAEGRITLADALSYAVEHKPQAIVDVATLTGACVVALGETIAGLWGTDEKLVETLQAAGSAAGEQIVRLPMPEEYKPMLESDIADLKNITKSSYGGAITGAMFLREFTNGSPWAHLDIAGPAYAERTMLPYYKEGATGFGVRTLAHFLRNFR